MGALPSRETHARGLYSHRHGRNRRSEMILIPLTSEFFPSPDCSLFQHLYHARRQRTAKYYFRAVRSMETSRESDYFCVTASVNDGEVYDKHDRERRAAQLHSSATCQRQSHSTVHDEGSQSQRVVPEAMASPLETKPAYAAAARVMAGHDPCSHPHDHTSPHPHRCHPPSPDERSAKAKEVDYAHDNFSDTPAGLYRVLIQDMDVCVYNTDAELRAAYTRQLQHQARTTPSVRAQLRACGVCPDGGVPRRLSRHRDAGGGAKCKPHARTAAGDGLGAGSTHQTMPAGPGAAAKMMRQEPSSTDTMSSHPSDAPGTTPSYVPYPADTVTTAGGIASSSPAASVAVAVVADSAATYTAAPAHHGMEGGTGHVADRHRSVQSRTGMLAVMEDAQGTTHDTHTIAAPPPQSEEGLLCADMPCECVPFDAFVSGYMAAKIYAAGKASHTHYEERAPSNDTKHKDYSRFPHPHDYTHTHTYTYTHTHPHNGNHRSHCCIDDNIFDSMMTNSTSIQSKFWSEESAADDPAAVGAERKKCCRPVSVIGLGDGRCQSYTRNNNNSADSNLNSNSNDANDNNSRSSIIHKYDSSKDNNVKSTEVGSSESGRRLAAQNHTERHTSRGCCLASASEKADSGKHTNPHIGSCCISKTDNGDSRDAVPALSSLPTRLKHVTAPTAQYIRPLPCVIASRYDPAKPPPIHDPNYTMFDGYYVKLMGMFGLLPATVSMRHAAVSSPLPSTPTTTANTAASQESALPQSVSATTTKTAATMTQTRERTHDGCCCANGTPLDDALNSSVRIGAFCHSNSDSSSSKDCNRNKYDTSDVPDERMCVASALDTTSSTTVPRAAATTSSSVAHRSYFRRKEGLTNSDEDAQLGLELEQHMLKATMFVDKDVGDQVLGNMAMLATHMYVRQCLQAGIRPEYIPMLPFVMRFPLTNIPMLQFVREFRVRLRSLMQAGTLMSGTQPAWLGISGGNAKDTDEPFDPHWQRAEETSYLFEEDVPRVFSDEELFFPVSAASSPATTNAMTQHDAVSEQDAVRTEHLLHLPSTDIATAGALPNAHTLDNTGKRPDAAATAARGAATSLPVCSSHGNEVPWQPSTVNTNTQGRYPVWLVSGFNIQNPSLRHPGLANLSHTYPGYDKQGGSSPSHDAHIACPAFAPHALPYSYADSNRSHCSMSNSNSYNNMSAMTRAVAAVPPMPCPVSVSAAGVAPALSVGAAAARTPPFALPYATAPAAVSTTTRDMHHGSSADYRGPYPTLPVMTDHQAAHHAHVLAPFFPHGYAPPSCYPSPAVHMQAAAAPSRSADITSSQAQHPQPYQQQSQDYEQKQMQLLQQHRKGRFRMWLDHGHFHIWASAAYARRACLLLAQQLNTTVESDAVPEARLWNYRGILHAGDTAPTPQNMNDVIVVGEDIPAAGLWHGDVLRCCTLAEMHAAAAAEEATTSNAVRPTSSSFSSGDAIGGRRVAAKKTIPLMGLCDGSRECHPVDARAPMTNDNPMGGKAAVHAVDAMLASDDPHHPTHRPVATATTTNAASAHGNNNRTTNSNIDSTSAHVQGGAAESDTHRVNDQSSTAELHASAKASTTAEAAIATYRDTAEDKDGAGGGNNTSNNDNSSSAHAGKATMVCGHHACTGRAAPPGAFWVRAAGGLDDSLTNFSECNLTPGHKAERWLRQQQQQQQQKAVVCSAQASAPSVIRATSGTGSSAKSRSIATAATIEPTTTTTNVVASALSMATSSLAAMKLTPLRTTPAVSVMYAIDRRLGTLNLEEVVLSWVKLITQLTRDSDENDAAWVRSPDGQPFRIDRYVVRRLEHDGVRLFIGVTPRCIGSHKKIKRILEDVYALEEKAQQQHESQQPQGMQKGSLCARDAIRQTLSRSPSDGGDHTRCTAHGTVRRMAGREPNEHAGRASCDAFSSVHDTSKLADCGGYVELCHTLMTRGGGGNGGAVDAEANAAQSSRTPPQLSFKILPKDDDDDLLLHLGKLHMDFMDDM